MSHVHGSNALRQRSFFQKGIDGFLMQVKFEELLQFREISDPRKKSAGFLNVYAA